MDGSQGPRLGGCGFDYPQNWYDQGLAVDPNNADRLFVDTYDIWFANRTGSTFNNLTCGYQGVSGHVVHVDQHALAFVNGSSSILLVGSDGGAFSTVNANVANETDGADLDQHGRRPEHDRVLLGRHQRVLRELAEPVGRRGRTGQRAQRRRVLGLSDRPRAVADDDRRRRLLRAHRPGRARRGESRRYFVGNNSGGMSRCVTTAGSTCLTGGAGYSTVRGNWTGDTQSFILPFDLFHGGVPGGDDCAPAGIPGGCGHLVAGNDQGLGDDRGRQRHHERRELVRHEQPDDAEHDQADARATAPSSTRSSTRPSGRARRSSARTTRTSGSASTSGRERHRRRTG